MYKIIKTGFACISITATCWCAIYAGNEPAYAPQQAGVVGGVATYDFDTVVKNCFDGNDESKRALQTFFISEGIDAWSLFCNPENFTKVIAKYGEDNVSKTFGKDFINVAAAVYTATLTYALSPDYVNKQLKNMFKLYTAAKKTISSRRSQKTISVPRKVLALRDDLAKYKTASSKTSGTQRLLPLHEAAKRQNAGEIAALLFQGADPNFPAMQLRRDAQKKQTSEKPISTMELILTAGCQSTPENVVACLRLLKDAGTTMNNLDVNLVLLCNKSNIQAMAVIANGLISLGASLDQDALDEADETITDLKKSADVNGQKLLDDIKNTFAAGTKK